jgi:tetratricopeptide (TPR) repeat protein
VGETFSAARPWEHAIHQYRKTLELDPSVALVHENLGTALEEICRHDEAIAEYLAARALWGEDVRVVAELRKAHEKHGLRGFRQKQLQLALLRWRAGMWTLFSSPRFTRAWAIENRRWPGWKKPTKLAREC